MLQNDAICVEFEIYIMYCAAVYSLLYRRKAEDSIKELPSDERSSNTLFQR